MDSTTGLMVASDDPPVTCRLLRPGWRAQTASRHVASWIDGWTQPVRIHSIVSSKPDEGGGVVVSVKEQAPDFELTNDTGESVKLSDFRGKKVILYFYPRALTKG
jgi:hypothetical protein